MAIPCRGILHRIGKPLEFSNRGDLKECAFHGERAQFLSFANAFLNPIGTSPKPVVITLIQNAHETVLTQESCGLSCDFLWEPIEQSQNEQKVQGGRSD